MRLGRPQNAAESRSPSVVNSKLADCAECASCCWAKYKCGPANLLIEYYHPLQDFRNNDKMINQNSFQLKQNLLVINFNSNWVMIFACFLSIPPTCYNLVSIDIMNIENSTPANNIEILCLKQQGKFAVCAGTHARLGVCAGGRDVNDVAS